MAAVLYYEPLVMMGPGAIARVCGRFGLTVIPVSRERAGQTVGFLAGYQGFPERAETETTGCWCSARWTGTPWTRCWRS